MRDLLDPARYVLMVILSAAVTVGGISGHAPAAIILGFVLTILSLIGMVIDHFRQSEIRTLRRIIRSQRDELGAVRNIEQALRRQLQQQRRHT